MKDEADSSGTAPRAATVERRGDRGLAIRRQFAAPPAAVFEAWSRPDLFQRWWVPRSAPGVLLLACDMDVRTGGRYRLEFGADGSDSMAFYGNYLDVVEGERIVWTNDEDEDGAVTTVSFESRSEGTLLTFEETYPSTAAREEALQGGAAALPEQLDQLDDLLSGKGS